MASLPTNTFASPGNPYYALVDTGGGGSASSLQSPASVLPGPQGNVSLTMASTDPLANSTLFINSADGLAILNLDANDVGGAFINMNGLNGAPFFVTNATGVAPFQYTMTASPARVGQTPFLTYDPSAGTLALGDSLPAGAVVTNQPLRVQSAPTNGNSVVIASESSSRGSISNTVTGANLQGTLSLNPTAGTPVLTVFNNGSGGTNTTFADNGEGAIIIQGGIPTGPGGIPINPRIYASLLAAPATPITLNLGTETNQDILKLSDTPNPNATVTGDIVITGTALVNGSLTTDDIVLTGVSSAIQVPGQGGAGQPPVGINMSVSQTRIAHLELAPYVNGSFNSGIVGQASFNFNINSTGQAAGVIGNTGAQVGGPGALGDLALEGLYIVSLVCSNASTDIYSKLAQIRTVSYWNPVTGWFGGSGGASTFGGAEFRAGINPSNVIAAGQLWVTNTSGNNWTGMTTNVTQITGVIPGYFVA